MADGFVDGDNLICGVHNWDYRLDTGISEYSNDEKLHKFNAWIEVGVDYVILDGRGGGTGAAPILFRDNISVPTIPALARLQRFFESAVDLMKILARACGHSHLNQFTLDDLVTWKEDMAALAGLAYGGVGRQV